ncbi:uracil-DNA glycosylase [Pseudoduganella sp. OTU4001]|uniref:uracil-DNA glycosylase n=1 Tax=Pseudoduganella sp. OTU4001 TaxID=3043854 RepID=UPI00313D7471
MTDNQIEFSWRSQLAEEFRQPYWESLADFVRTEYVRHTCFPATEDIFRAFELTPFDKVRAVILAQDPYHSDGAAIGLGFSLSGNKKAQPSLRNIFRELESDLGVERKHTDLSDWAAQGVLLLNCVMTVRKGKAGSHRGKGWEQFTDSAIRHLSAQHKGLVFILWGDYARAKRTQVDAQKHLVIESRHPSPRRAHEGFFGSRPFSRANTYLEKMGKAPINWA